MAAFSTTNITVDEAPVVNSSGLLYFSPPFDFSRSQTDGRVITTVDSTSTSPTKGQLFPRGK